jgi:hypothetical protein
MSHKDYKNLCKRVALINKGAARYMRTKAIKLDGFAYAKIIMGCFYFGDTPQGIEYWQNISRQLSEGMIIQKRDWVKG